MPERTSRRIVVRSRQGKPRMKPRCKTWTCYANTRKKNKLLSIPRYMYKSRRRMRVRTMAKMSYKTKRRIKATMTLTMMTTMEKSKGKPGSHPLRTVVE